MKTRNLVLRNFRLSRAPFFSALTVCVLATRTIGVTAPANSQEIKLISPAPEATVSQLNSAQKAFLAMPRKERIEFFADPDKRLQLTQDAGYYPQPVEFEWRWEGHDGANYTLHVSLTDDFEKEWTFTTNACKAMLDNFRINSTYYWKITAREADGAAVSSENQVLKTADEAPRLLRVDGVPNVRDLGGRRTMDGKRVRQDMVFRTAGLNDNASPVYEDKEVVLNKDNGILRKKRDQMLAQIDDLKKQLQNAEKIEYVPFSLSPTWAAFRPAKGKLAPEDIEFIEKLTAIPDELLGAKREDAVMDQKGFFSFGKPVVYAPSVFMQEFESPSEGVMQIGCGADWFWDFRINGVKALDIMDGNNKAPVAADNFVFNIPVKKGKNLATVVLLSGSADWSWCCAAQPRMPLEKMLNGQIAYIEDNIKRMLKVVKCLEPGKNRLNADMKRYMLEDLGIKTDIDLRSDQECFGMTGSPLGNTVNWAHVSSRAYQYMQNHNGKEAFAKVFRIFCDEKNYPIVFHCIAGQDRTGAVAFILNGLLGINEEELYKDWETSGFWNNNPSFAHANRFNKLIEGFQENYRQPTWKEKIEAYVLSIGITQEDIEKFRGIMLED